MMMSEDTAEWTRVVQDVGPSLYRYFLGSFPAPVASDLVQETLIRLVQKQRAGVFDPKVGEIKNYAFGIARYVRLEKLKDKSTFDLASEDPSANVSYTDRSHESDPVTHLRWAIGKLKPIEQELVLEMIDNECTFETLSQNFKMPIGTVKSHIHRAKERLKQLMEIEI